LATANLADPIRDIASRVERLHVIFNNCFEDQGQRNATTLIGMLGGVEHKTGGWRTNA